MADDYGLSAMTGILPVAVMGMVAVNMVERMNPPRGRSAGRKSSCGSCAPKSGYKKKGLYPSRQARRSSPLGFGNFSNIGY